MNEKAKGCEGCEGCKGCEGYKTVQGRVRGGAARQHGVTLLGVGLVEGKVGRRLAQREAEGVGRPHVQQLARHVREAHGVVHPRAEHVDGALLEGLAVGLHGLV